MTILGNPGRMLCLAAGAIAAATVVQAGRNDLLVGMDGKTFFEPEGMRYGPGGGDSLAIPDISDPAHPKLRGRSRYPIRCSGRRPTCKSRPTENSDCWRVRS